MAGEQQPRGPLTPDQVREAYQRGDKETLNAWYLERQEAADRDPTSVGRFELSVDLARIRYGAGELEDARDVISGANTAIQEELIELDRPESPAFNHVNKETYRAKLKSLLQNVIVLRNEFRR